MGQNKSVENIMLSYSSSLTSNHISNNHFLHLDIPLLIALTTLSALGMAILYSSGSQDINLIIKQAVRLGIAFSVMFVLAQIPPQQYLRWSHWLFIAGLLLLIAVLVTGEMGKGAQRWLNLGFVRFQPSELMKIAVPMMLAWYFAEKPLPPSTKQVILSLTFILIPTLLIAKQPDLGTSLLVASAGAFVLFFSGIRYKFIIGAMTLLAMMAPGLWYMMHDYQRTRVITFLNPERDPLGAGYHIIQSKIAIGSGGLIGKGWLNGTQSHLEFLPERKTDFIFSVYAEEFGLIGVLILLSIYLFIIVRGTMIASKAQDTYSKLLAGSITFTFFVYIFVNIGMVSGILPVVGVPLPLISYGGTSMVTLMAGFGILMSIHSHKKLLHA